MCEHLPLKLSLKYGAPHSWNQFKLILSHKLIVFKLTVLFGRFLNLLDTKRKTQKYKIQFLCVFCFVSFSPTQLPCIQKIYGHVNSFAFVLHPQNKLDPGIWKKRLSKNCWLLFFDFYSQFHDERKTIAKHFISKATKWLQNNEMEMDGKIARSFILSFIYFKY